MRKVYICGKVSDELRADVELKFNYAEMLLTFNNYDAVNPIALVPEETTWENAMNICIRAMLDCTHIYLLEDWRQSRGARIEYQLSKALKLTRVNSKSLCLI